MKKNIHFTPAAGGMISVPVEGSMIESYEEVEQGKLRRIKSGPTKYIILPDMSDRQTLKLYAEDISVACSALVWVSGQTEISFGTISFKTNKQGQTVQVKQGGKIIEIPIYGRFEPELSADDIHIFCEDFRLLSSHFPVYQDIFKIKTAENKFASALMDYLVESQIKTNEILAELGVGKKLLKLPDWALRVIKLRKETIK